MPETRSFESYTIEELLKHDDRYISRLAEEIPPAVRKNALGTLAKSQQKIVQIPAKNLLEALHERQGKGKAKGTTRCT